MAKAHKLVYVVWEDIVEPDEPGWVDTDADSPEPCLFEQVGWLIEHTHDALVMTFCLGKDHLGTRTRIPIGVVKTMLELDPAAGLPLKIRKQRRVKKQPPIAS